MRGMSENVGGIREEFKTDFVIKFVDCVAWGEQLQLCWALCKKKASS